MSSFHFPARLFSISLFTFLCLSNPALIGSIKDTDTELNEICSQTSQVVFCLYVFRHYVDSKEASLIELCGIGLYLGVTLSVEAQDHAEQYALLEAQPELKSKYEFCQANYDLILTKIGTEARRAAMRGNFGVVKSAAGEAFVYAVRCSKLFGKDSPVGQESRHTETIARALVAIANKLI